MSRPHRRYRHFGGRTDLIHQMRTRIVLSRGGKPAAQYLWHDKGVVPS